MENGYIWSLNDTFSTAPEAARSNAPTRPATRQPAGDEPLNGRKAFAAYDADRAHTAYPGPRQQPKQEIHP